MHEEKFSLSYKVFTKGEGLSEEDHLLMDAASKITDNAYAVYSGFNVGAAILLDDGSIVTGNNQENIAFPSSLCAERVALYYCNANFPDKEVKKIAITAKSKEVVLTGPVTPCGACRQVISEYERIQDGDIEVLLFSEDRTVYYFDSISTLLPLAFETDALKRK